MLERGNAFTRGFGKQRSSHRARAGGIGIYHFPVSLLLYVAAIAYLHFGAAAVPDMGWRHSFFIPLAVYLGACFVKGLRFAFLFQEGKRLRLESSLPFQEAYALNNATFFYLTDVFIFWFYKPFVPGKRLVSAIALTRCGDCLILGAGFAFFAFSYGGLWSAFLAAIIIYGAACAVYLFKFHSNLIKKKFIQIFSLSFLAWFLEGLAVSLLFLLQRGDVDHYLNVGFKGVYDAFILGPQLMYNWFFLAHFVVGFASLLLISYKKE